MTTGLHHLPDRLIGGPLRADLRRKFILLSGPRQVGKTTFSRSLQENHAYLNFDDEDDRRALLKRSWDRRKPLLVLDELHKMKNWKSWLKGIYDKEGLHPPVLVTGSARLDVAKKMGDSMAGRFFQYRLYPFDLHELRSQLRPEAAYDLITRFSGFPEPLLQATDEFYGKWKVSHLDIILRQDLLSLENVRDISTLETLIFLLQERVGSTISCASLARDLQKDAKTVKHWLQILESLFIVFKVTPYHRKVARSLLKEPKYYFYDIARVKNGTAAKLENVVALSLKKYLDYAADAKGRHAQLHFMRLKSGEEIDFYVVPENGPGTLVEVKWSDEHPSPHFGRFAKFLHPTHQIQLVRNLKREATYPSGVEVRAALPWLSGMPLD